MILKIVLIVLELLYIVAMWRIATFMCVRCKWLIIIPIAQWVYFAYVADKISVETHEKFRHLRFVVVGLVILISVGISMLKFFHYDITEILGRIFIATGGVFLILSLVYGYVTILLNSTERAIVLCLLSLIIPFPIILMYASFLFPEYMEETLELYWGQ